MFNPLKGLSDLNTLKNIQQALSAEEVVGESGHVRVIMSGDQKVKAVYINDQPTPDVTNAINDAISKIHQLAATKFMSMGGNQ